VTTIGAGERLPGITDIRKGRRMEHIDPQKHIEAGTAGTAGSARMPGTSAGEADGHMGGRTAEAAMSRAQREVIAINRIAHDLRLVSFRTFMQETVGAMSSLTPAALEMVGFDIDVALDCLRPADSWPVARDARWPGPRRRMAAGSRKRIRPSSMLADHLWRQHDDEHVGDAIIREGVFGEYMLLAVFGSSVEFHLRGSGFRLMTHAGVVHLTLERQLPEIVAAACRGRALDDLVDLTLCRGRGFEIDEVMTSEERTTIVFRSGEEAVRMPWHTEA
jgi:hypothetical protein